MFNQKPVEKPQPEAASYPINELFLFNRLTRATYKELFGEEAPAYDPSRNIKRWGDTTKLVAADGTPIADPSQELCVYNVWDERKGAIVKKVFTNAEAASVNLPGFVVYPKWNNPQETVAVVLDADGTAPVNGLQLCSREDAETMKAEMEKQLSVTISLVENVIEEGNPYKIIWNGETRRFWNLQLPGKDPMNCGELGKMRWGSGWGCTGRWVLNNLGYPQFIADVISDGAMDPRPEVPFPVRPLYGNEKLVAGFGNIYHVERTDWAETVTVGGNGSVSALTVTQALQLSQISADIKKVLAIITS